MLSLRDAASAAAGTAPARTGALMRWLAAPAVVDVLEELGVL